MIKELLTDILDITHSKGNRISDRKEKEESVETDIEEDWEWEREEDKVVRTQVS